MKSIIFWDMTPCSPLSVSRRFGETYSLHLQGRRNKFSKKPASKLLATCLLDGFLMKLFLRPWKWRRYVPPKRRLTLKGLHGVISQKMILFKSLHQTNRLLQVVNTRYEGAIKPPVHFCLFEPPVHFVCLIVWLFVCSLFNDVVNNSDYTRIASNDLVTVNIWKRSGKKRSWPNLTF
jgi:hypothetical protein